MYTSIGGCAMVRIHGRVFFLDSAGKVSWGLDGRGWHVGVFEVKGGETVPASGKYSVQTFRRKLRAGEIVVR